MTSTSDSPENSTAASGLLSEARQITDARLEQVAGRLRADHPGSLGEAIAYALGTAGKRVRPALVLAAYRAAGGGGKAGAIAGICAAVEIVHTYSLVHDDLPCMDDDDTRRGRPTTHTRFGVATATEAGFLLVPVAVEEVVAAGAELGLDADRAGRMVVRLLEASGPRGMIGGQWLDLEAEGRELGLDQVMDIHRRKTGALIAAACGLGALAAGASAPVLEALEGYGREVGLAFQIADDVLDATATTAQLGKTAGRDAALAKSTYVGLLGVQEARKAAEECASRAMARIEAERLGTPELAGLAGYIVKRTA